MYILLLLFEKLIESAQSNSRIKIKSGKMRLPYKTDVFVAFSPYLYVCMFSFLCYH